MSCLGWLARWFQSTCLPAFPPSARPLLSAASSVRLLPTHPHTMAELTADLRRLRLLPRFALRTARICWRTALRTHLSARGPSLCAPPIYAHSPVGSPASFPAVCGVNATCSEVNSHLLQHPCPHTYASTGNTHPIMLGLDPEPSLHDIDVHNDLTESKTGSVPSQPAASTQCVCRHHWAEQPILQPTLDVHACACTHSYMVYALLSRMPCKGLQLTALLHVRAGAALADQIVGSKAYRNHACTFAMIAVALAQFVVTGLLPLSSDLFFIIGALPSSRISASISPASQNSQSDMQVVQLWDKAGAQVQCHVLWGKMPATAVQQGTMEKELRHDKYQRNIGRSVTWKQMIDLQHSHIAQDPWWQAPWSCACCLLWSLCSSLSAGGHFRCLSVSCFCCAPLIDGGPARLRQEPACQTVSDTCKLPGNGIF